MRELPVNEWVVLHEHLPNIPYESTMSYDPRVRGVVYLAGHIGRLYPQSNYAVLYEFRRNRFFLSQAMYRPQRRCLISSAYLDSVQRVLSCNGSMSHGSMPEGGLGGDYQAVLPKASVGPWLYDALDDEWENCRPLGAQWKPRSYAPVAYESSSDLVACLGTSDLMLYRAWTNQVLYRALPDTLKNRGGYAIAADPVRRVFVVFGGVDRSVKREGLSREAAHERSAKADTWVYDIDKDQWRECRPKTSPPRGMPMHGAINLAMTYHPPSGTCLLLQPNVDTYEADPAKWGGTRLWSFDVVEEEWTNVETKNVPAVHGLLDYASHQDALVLIGGGLDGVFDDERTHSSPALSRQVQVCRVQVPGRRIRSGPLPRPTFGQPRRPSGLAAGVESVTDVRLCWRAGSTDDIAGYHVYRAEEKQGEESKGTRLTEKPVIEPRFTDTAVDLSDGVICSYWVTAVNRQGVESGPSPLAYTVPDAPRGFTVMEGVSPSNTRGIKLGYHLSWEWPKDMKVAGFNLYHAREHLNTFEHPKHYEAFWPLWTKLNEKPLTTSEFAFFFPKNNPPNHYFYVRAVNILRQEGFYSDIVSPTDGQYRPAQP